MTEDKIRLIVGTLIAFVLLFLYAFVLIKAVGIALEAPPAGALEAPPADRPAKSLPEGASYVLQIVGGLVSAVVAAQLAVTQRGKVPDGQVFGLIGEHPPRQTANIAAAIALLYLAVWFILGVVAVIMGLIEAKTPVKPLEEFAKAWLGLALAAAYAYFGIEPKKPADNR